MFMTDKELNGTWACTIQERTKTSEFHVLRIQSSYVHTRVTTKEEKI